MPWTLRFRLYPNREQEEKMLRTLDTCRHLWNDALFHRIQRWEDRKSTSYNLQQWILTAERQVDFALSSVYSQTAQDVLRRLDKAFRAFFDSRARHPRFKKYGQHRSFTYPQAYNGSVKTDVTRGRLYFSRIGNVKTVFHRCLPAAAILKTCTVIREPDDKWFASLVFEEVVPLQDVRIPFMQCPIASPIGVDLGLNALITTSDGDKVEHPRFLRKAEKRLKRAQRMLARKERGSNNWFKARQRLASQHSKIRRQRADFNHKLSHLLVKEHDFIVFEDLRIANMMRNHSLAKSIYDAAWGQLVKFTTYKGAKLPDKLVIDVSAAKSTQECFFCGELNPLPLKIREYECVGCHRVLDRDVNAARVVLKRGLAQVGQDMPEFKPVETEPLRVRSTGRASSAAEAGTRDTRARL
jgi:putative transposase